MQPDSSALRRQIKERGFSSEALPLADTRVLSSLIADAGRFDEAVALYEQEGQHRVPYLMTEAIARVAQDTNLVAAVENVLDTDHWVMWGPNIRRDTPNQAHRWHVDLESTLWPCLTVAVGLQDCVAGSATSFIPASHRLRRGPRQALAARGDAAVVARAKTANHQCEDPESIANFDAGRFYLFDARCWHRGCPESSRGRLVLFLHYQHADAKRVPYMLDYDLDLWAREAAPFLVPELGPDDSARRPVNTSVARPSLRHTARQWLHRLRMRMS